MAPSLARGVGNGKYVLLLNRAGPADRAEARRVLNVALTMFDRAGITQGSARPATGEIRRALARLRE